MSTTAVAVHAPAVAAWRDLVALLKLRIGALIVATAVCAAVAAGARDLVELGVLALGCLAASSGASALNHVVDRDLDRRMARTSGRPVAAGRVTPLTGWVLGVALVACSLGVVPALGWITGAYLIAGAATYVVVYSAWLKRRTPYAIVVGGVAGSFAALAGWATAGSTWAPASQLLATVLFLWTPPHFWSLAIVLERDYRAAGVPALSTLVGASRTATVVSANAAALVATSLALGAYAGWTYLAVAAPAGAGFLVATERLRRRPVVEEAWRTFKLSGLYLLVVLLGLVLSALT